jgi:F420-dependent oxidoreductase-like protein
MRFSFWTGNSQTWDDIHTGCRHAADTGWDGIWFADHFMPFMGDETGPVHEAWTVLAAIGATVPGVRIGPLVTGNTYRNPAVLAKMAATVDHISAGRCVLGLGAGWQENEHRAYGLEFSTVRGRLDRLEEACRVIKALFADDVSNLDLEHYRLVDAPLSPKPVQDRLPLLIGGGGEKRTLRITAQYADEWNVWGDPELLRQKMAVLDDHCADVGRDPGEIERSAVALLFLSDDREYLDKMRSRDVGRPTIIGDVDEVSAVVADYQAAGVHELIVPDFNLGPMESKLATLDRFIGEVAPAFR